MNHALRMGRLCIWIAISFVVIAVAGTSVIISGLRLSAISQGERAVSQVFDQVTEGLTRDLGGVELGLLEAEQVLERQVRRGGDPAAIASSDDLHAALITITKRSGLLASVAVSDRSGHVLAWSRSQAIDGLSVQDMEFFRSLAQTAGPFRLHVSRPSVSRVTGQTVVFVSYRLAADSGDFAGAAIGTLPVQQIADRMAAIVRGSGKGVDATLLLDDGTVLASTSTTAMEHDGGDGSLTLSKELPQTATRLVVQMPQARVLAQWRRESGFVIAAAIVATACVLLFLFALWRQLKRQQAIQRSLGDRNQQLIHARRTADAQREALETTTRALAAQEGLLQTTLEHIGQGILMVDAGDRVVIYNHRVCELLDVPDTFLRSRPTFAELADYQWRTGEFIRTDSQLQRSIRVDGVGAVPLVYERQRPNGTWIEVCTSRLGDGGIVRTYSDITERKQAQLQIERTALFDELTDLPNRISLRNTLQQRLSASEGHVALFFVNLDRFRLLNDARGHSVGDSVLKTVARRLTAWRGESDVCGRVGGDEFAIVRSMQPGDDVDAAATDLLSALSQWQEIGSDPVTVTGSVGVTVQAVGASAEQMFREADIAMYRAKDSGRNRHCRYDEAMGADRQEEFTIEQALRAAVATTDLWVAYQPIYSTATSSVAGFEALLRWRDPIRGDIPPAQFIPIAERTGLIIPIGRDVLEWACREAAQWTARRTVAVNLSPVQFQEDNVLDLVETILARTRLSPDRLELEITEGMLLQDTGPVRNKMLALRDLGVSLTLDDFGTGHAGLSYLNRFPFQKFKIDRSFIRNLGESGQADAIVEEMLQLAGRLNMRVVAEGVETEAQLNRLRLLGCDYIQGFLMGIPTSAELARAL